MDKASQPGHPLVSWMQDQHALRCGRTPASSSGARVGRSVGGTLAVGARGRNALGHDAFAGYAEVGEHVCGESVLRSAQAERGVLLERGGIRVRRRMIRDGRPRRVVPGAGRPDIAMTCTQAGVSDQSPSVVREARPAPGPLPGAYPRRCRAQIWAVAALATRRAGRAERSRAPSSAISPRVISCSGNKLAPRSSAPKEVVRVLDESAAWWLR
jgi:hypothetical protein